MENTFDKRWILSCPNCNSVVQFKTNRSWNQRKRQGMKFCASCRSDYFLKKHPFRGKELHKLQGAHYERDTILEVRWAKDVKSRDNWKCRECGDSKKLHAHHLYPRAVFPEIRYHINNGVTLCNKCHTKIHSDVKMTFWKNIRKGEL